LDLLFLTFVFGSGMAAENARGSEFTQLMANHILGHIHGDEFVAVMHSDGLADKVGGNHAGAAPCLDGNLLVRLLSLDNSFLQFVEDIRTLL